MKWRLISGGEGEGVEETQPNGAKLTPLYTSLMEECSNLKFNLLRKTVVVFDSMYS